MKKYTSSLLVLLIIGCASMKEKKHYQIVKSQNLYVECYQYLIKNTDSFDSSFLNVNANKIVVYPELVNFDPFSIFFTQINNEESLKEILNSGKKIETEDLKEVNDKIQIDSTMQRNFNSYLKEIDIKNPKNIIFFTAPYKNIVFAMLQKLDPKKESFSAYTVQGDAYMIMFQLESNRVKKMFVEPFHFGV